MSEAISMITDEVMSKSLANISVWKIAVLTCGVLSYQLEEMCPLMLQQIQFQQKQETHAFFLFFFFLFFFLTKDTQG